MSNHSHRISPPNIAAVTEQEDSNSSCSSHISSSSSSSNVPGTMSKPDGTMHKAGDEMRKIRDDDDEKQSEPEWSEDAPSKGENIDNKSENKSIKNKSENKGNENKSTNNNDTIEAEQGEIEEATRAKPVTNPSNPTQQEINDHKITHLPYRSWCPHCVRGKAREDGHYTRDKSTNEVPVISIDYGFMSGKKKHDAEIEDELQIYGTIIVIHDSKTKAIIAHSVPRKGINNGWIVEQINEDINNLGHSKIIVKCDQEPSIIQIQKGIAEIRSHETVPEVTLVGSSASNGPVEHAIREVMGHIRTLKSNLEEELRVKVKQSDAIMTWMVNHAAMTITRYQIGRDGRTAYERVKGKACSKTMVQFAEKILYKVPYRKGEHKEKCEPKWEYAIWVGTAPRSHEHIVCTSQGARKCRSIRRLRDELKWDAKAVLDIQCTPWNWKIPAKGEPSIDEEEKCEEEEHRTVVEQSPIEIRPGKGTLKRLYIKKQDVIRYGETKNCAGCKAVKLSKRGVAHTEECRSRLEKEIKFHEPTRIEKNEERSNRNIAEELEKNIKILDLRSLQRDTDPTKKVDALEEVRSNNPAMIILDNVRNDDMWVDNIKHEQRKNGGIYVHIVDKHYQQQEPEGEIRLHGTHNKYAMIMQPKTKDRKPVRIHMVTNSQLVEEVMSMGDGQKRYRCGMIKHLEDNDTTPPKITSRMMQDLQQAAEIHTAYHEYGIMGINIDTPNMENEDDEDEKVTMDENGHWKRLFNVNEWAAYDDISGALLNPEKVRKARAEEMEYFKRMHVYDVVNRSAAVQAGKKIIGVRWIDINKGDTINENYRSRFVGKEFKMSSCPELFAATPPLEVLRAIMSIAANTDNKSKYPHRCIMVNDISRAYFHAPASRDVFIELPDEEPMKKEGKIGKLRVSLYGTRDAALNWQSAYSSHLQNIGFKQCKYSPCIFYHEQKDLCTMVHGDDYVTTGGEKELQWLSKELAKIFDVKTTIIGPGDEQHKEAKVLNRIIRYTAHGIEHEPDPRHAEILVHEMNLTNATPVTTPGCEQAGEGINEERDETTDTKFRALAARANYLAIDRPDIQYAAKEVCRCMSKPTTRDWEKLKRLVRYLLGKPRLIHTIAYQTMPNHLSIFADANWAGCRRTRKSTSGGLVQMGDHYIKSWAKTQSTIATSSAEAELYAVVKATQEGMATAAIYAAYQRDIKIKLWCDASAALAIVQRNGLGKTKHVQVGWLWIQQMAKRDKANFNKINGQVNPADLMTKNLTKNIADRHLSTMSCKFTSGRADAAPNMAMDET